jgi:iron complex outermembrane recepter protein
MGNSGSRRLQHRKAARSIGQASLAAILATAGLTLPHLLQAQELQQITVTATKRGETALQDTPLSITALGTDTLESMGADSAVDFLRSVPGLVFEDQGIGDKKYSIRGVQSVGAATVAVYFDDLVLTANNRQDGGGRNVDPKLVDMERIEVLRGPQGTLYGASAMTGTVRYIYNKPNLANYQAQVNAQVTSTEYSSASYSVDGVVNLPLVDNRFGVRLVGYDRSIAGWIDRPLIDQHDVNGEDTVGGRAHLLWNVTEALSINGTFMHQESTTDGRTAWQEAARNDPLNQELYQQCDVRQTCTGEITRSGQRDRWNAYDISANYHTGFGDFYATSSLLDRDFVRSLDNSILIASIRGIRFPDGSYDRFNPRARHMIQQIQPRKLWSNEMRFSSAWQGPLQLITGAFYQRDKNEFSSNVGSTDAEGNFADPAVRDNSLWRTVNNEVHHSAFFGEVSYSFTPKFIGTVGGRYYEFDVKEVSNGIIGCCAGNTPGTGPGPLRRSHDTGINMKYNLSYNLTDDVMFYAQGAEGFRAGGTNEPSIEPLPQCQGFEGYGSDSLWNYEVGVKSSWLNRRLTVNFTPYLLDWSDMQIRVMVPICRSFFIQNAGKARVYGAELETAWQATESLNFTVGLGYADARLEGDQPLQQGPLVDGRDGDPIPYTPDFTGKLGVQYQAPLSFLPADLMVRTDWAYTGSSKTQFRDTNPTQRVMPAYSIVDFHIGLVGHSGWRTTLFVKNAFNDLSDVSRYGSATLGSGDFVFTHRPREIGLAVSKDFGTR